MKYLQKLFSRQFYRTILFWVLLFVSIYTIGGFIVLPKFINDTIVAQVDKQLGWQAKIDKIEFNPYAFTFSIDNLKIADQNAQEQISFRRFYLNFELRSIIEGAFTFADIELLDPVIHVTLDKNGLTNFQLAQQKQLAKNPPIEQEEAENTESKLVKLLIDNVNLVGGDISIADNTQTKPINYRLSPITFNLKNFFTYGDKESSYHLALSLGKDQNITWDGSLGITPVRSSGSLKITGFRVQDFWEYLAEQVPYTLQNALVNISGQYQFDMANEPMQLNINDANIEVNDIKVANKQQSDSFANIKSLSVGPIGFNLAKKQVQIDTIKVDSADFKIERDKQGMISLLAPFTEETEQSVAITDNNNEVKNSTTPSPQTDQAATESPFKWSVKQVILSNSQVDFTDKQPTAGSHISVNKINVTVKNISQDLSKPLPFNIAYYVDQAGETNINGNVTATPLNLQAHISLKDLALPALQPYIEDLATVDLEKGKLSINGDINFANAPDGQVQGDFQGAFNIDQFNTTDTRINQRLLGWENLAIDPIKVNFNPLSIAIKKIAINQPYTRLVVTEDRSVNLAQLAIDNTPKKAASIPEEKAVITTESETETTAPVDIKIDKITIKDGEAYFADLSLRPQFATSIDNISGEINGLSSDNLARADVDINGSVEEYGKMQVKGKINPLSGDLYTDINASFKQIELAPLSPYSGRHVGYDIDKGKLTLILNYHIANNTLNATNHLILDQFTLGEKVKSAEALNLPLKLALALFTDRKGIIDIELPISGDMDSPDFAIGGILLKTLTNLITKAVTSPFSMVANLIGGDPNKLKAVNFELGASTLSAAQLKQLDTLAKVLVSRPKLALEIRVMVDKEQDGLVLKQSKMQNLLNTLGISNNTDQQQRIIGIEQLLTQYNASAALNKLQLAMQAKLFAAEKDTDKEVKQQLITDNYEKSLLNALQAKQPLTDLELTEFAQKRLKTIKKILIEQGKVADKQIFTLQPSLSGKAKDKMIATTFNLTSN